MSEYLQNMRRNYQCDALLESQLGDEPVSLLQAWLLQAIEYEVAPVEANAMFLASVDGYGRPHGRVVLLKALEAEGLIFYSHYGSAKGVDFVLNPYAAATFHWPGLERQVRVEGVIERVTADESDRYFHSRPLLSRLACIASPQSQPVASRDELESRMDQVQQQHVQSVPARPQDWGGYRLSMQRIEFWQGRPDRLHDRINYLKQDSGWSRERLAP
ncbi:Pyridoxamine 5'-phosphate oxidase [Pseudomonas peli]|uniref:Pyridoxine/pyridoxamine 5'-phosphate oxidase n=1 Tax=Pseudomonas peli TaxID=592361 RepID=A0AB37ZCN6_9PSED|nr:MULTISPECIES: pyridoxamine 5'-phosphate oxidase [Pseudomonas]NMZ70651.1 pyridoxamine 5'-phosphate oxidase [Pseudomonas peli]PJE40603.1 MAG: pyridoxamine 5'-phosphate oxidase [Pseudomonas sp.] [Pseudomonas sp. FEMGT703P]SCW71542.1 Pyridoxamine 5'-phosphate oxidase [Pseudomonas peli]|tara:strand:- start:31482 stop:32129 length:648 start_codon:yes stop_codon:yes gene_type:complete